MVAADIHGISGLDGTDLLPEADEECILRNEKAVLHMAQVIRDHPTKVTIVAVGPYTNVALLLTLFPELKANIEKISLMGGGIAGGNRTPVAEFNVLVRSAHYQVSGLAMILMSVTGRPGSLPYHL